MKRFPVVLAAFLFLSCSSSEESAEPVPDAEQPGPAYQTVTEIGVELGDSNYVFGAIEDVAFLADGRIAVLDATRKRVMVYSPEGDFLGSFGGTGEAPGEFLNPRSLAGLHDGRIAVSDPFSREVELFNPDLTHAETITSFTERAPFVITATETGFAGEQGGFNRDEGTITQKIVLWDLELDTTFTFREEESLFSPEYLAARFMQPQPGIVCRDGVIYFSPPVTDVYEVQAISLDGTSSDPLSFPDYSPVARPQAEIDEELQEFEDRLQAMAASGRGSRFADVEYAPPADYYATADLGLDGEGNIWVRRGWETEPVFDLFPPGADVPARTVDLSGLGLSEYSFVVTPRGIAAYEEDPLYYPKVIILEPADQ